MPLGTLDRTPPPFFRQGPSALTRLVIYSLLALLLMVADTRFRVSQPVRATMATLLYPVQWLVLHPIAWARAAGGHFQSLQAAQAGESAARLRLVQQAQRAAQVEQLTIENQRLRGLLALREQLALPGLAAEVLYDAGDIHTQKVVIDRGIAAGVQAGSPVIDATGVLGQVTRVYPWISEVTLVTDRDQAIPVLNTRTGTRGMAFGEPGSRSLGLELRYLAANADVQPGDLLTTSGVDGVYPPGLPVARVERVDRRADTPFARISCQPLAGVAGVGAVLVLAPVQLPDRLPAATTDAAPPERKGGRR